MENKITNLANLLQTCIDKKAHLAGKLLHAVILRNGFVSSNFLYNRLIEFYSKCNCMDYAYHVFDKIASKDVYSWNAILGAFCKADRLQDAYDMFVKMHERNTVSWNTLISAFVRKGYEGKALDLYDSMILEGIMPTRFTLASVFSAYGTLIDVDHGRKCHGLVVKIGLVENVYVVSALLCMYAKCGFLRDAIRLFEGILEPNEVTFTAMMSGLAQTDQIIEALEMFRLMYRKGIRVDSVSLTSILRVCAREGCREFGLYHKSTGIFCYLNGKLAHSLSVKLGFERDLHLNNSILDMYAKNGDMGSAERIFANMPGVSVVSWNVLIAGYGQENQSEKALESFQKMQACGFEPDEVTYINMLAACVRSGDTETAGQIFDNMSCPSVGSWNTMLSGYFQKESYEEAVNLFREMQFQQFQFDRTTLAIILSSCAAVGLIQGGKQVHAASLKVDLHTDLYVASGLICLYSKSGMTEISKHIFNKILDPDIICWNSMIVGFSFNSQNEEAFVFFKKMRESGRMPTQYSYTTILTCCANRSCSLLGRQVHAQIEKEAFVNDIFVGTALLRVYCKCGETDGARKLFNTMSDKSTITWNEMIYGYAQNGHGEDAVDLYNDMIKCESPDVITFIAVLTACSHSGLVDIGIQIFNSMEKEYGVEPLLDHYTCIIDSLGRAGRFYEAEALLDKMPYKDDPIIWETLLSSSRVHDNVSLAKRAADELSRLDPHNSAPYVLLANTYASSGRWDDVMTVREMMNDKQVLKDPGYSLIEYKNGLTSIITDGVFYYG